jgi:hypothetical protein
MSRSGYSEGCDNLELYRANIDRATRGKRGRKFFADLAEALDALPEKKLTRGALETQEGAVCALGALRQARGIGLTDSLRESEWDDLGKAFGVAPMLCQEVMYMNDEAIGRHRTETDEERWQRVRAWVAEQAHAPVKP